MRILIVEDDRELNGLISLYLKKQYTTDSVYSKEDAISYIDSYLYDIVLLDRDLDGEDVGLTLIDAIKSKRIETGVLVISSFGCTDDKIEGSTAERTITWTSLSKWRSWPRVSMP